VRRLILIALLGSIAQLVDGTLGMAYGVTASTALLITGISPAVASASVHLSEVGTTLASGLLHWRFGNVDWRVVALIGAPGAVGAFAGATFLSSLSTESASLWVAGLLLLLVRRVGHPRPQLLDRQHPLAAGEVVLVGGERRLHGAEPVQHRDPARSVGEGPVGFGLVGRGRQAKPLGATAACAGSRRA